MAELKLENSIVDDRYYIERCLGRGSYAEIFIAFDQQKDDLPVIIKALNDTLQGTPDIELKRTLLENFQNEAIALDKVRHPHIIRRLGHGSAADLNGKVFHYLVLEYMAGGDLLSLCNKKPFSLPETLFYFQQVAEALAYAHSQQVIHRDIKPTNLLLSADHQVIKIADFGVAKMSHQADAEITRVGTDVYAPPEHHPDLPDHEDEEGMMNEKLTPSADVYSLAKTIYTAISGRAPRQFSRKPLTSLPPELAAEAWSDDLLRVLTKATAVRISDRYATVQEFWQEFANVANSSALAALAEDDADKTVVRSRLKATSNVERPSSQPNFQAAAVMSSHNPQKARIVVELPARIQDSGFGIQDAKAPGNQQPVAGSAHEAEKNQTTSAAPGKVAVPSHAAHQQAVGNPKAAAIGTRAMGSPAVRAERSAFERVRLAIKSDWLRRIFIIFLVATLIGLVASTYFHFAGERNLPFRWLTDKDGEIAAPFVNLRADPNGRSLRWLPKGTRVRALEERNGWVKVRVISVPPANLPPDAPRDQLDADTGWINKNLVQ